MASFVATFRTPCATLGTFARYDQDMSQLPPSQQASPTPSPSVPVAEPVNLNPTLKRRAADNVKKQYSSLPSWKKRLLIVSFLVALVGAIGTVIGFFQSKPPEQVQAQATVESLRTDAASGANLTPEQQAKLDQATAQVKAAGHWFYQKTAPHLAKIGFGFVIGFILGFAFRQFIKTMAVLAAIALVAGAAAAYFGYLDLGVFRSNLTASTGWVSDQLTGAKDIILKFIGASLSGTVGFVIGFMRR